MNSTAFMDNLRQLFAECDLDGSGSLGPDEFKELCSKIGLNTEAAEETFERLDIDKNSQITFDEFAVGFNQYRQSANTGGKPKSQTASSASTSPRSNLPAAAKRAGPGAPKLATPSPVSARARSRASTSRAGPPNSLGSTGGSVSSGNLTASGRSTSSSGTQFDLSSSCDLNGSYESPLQQSASATDLTGNSPVQPSGAAAQDSTNRDDDMIVYSSEMIQPSDGCSSGQFNSMLSNSSSLSQFKTMQDLLECVQKLQNENQILTQIFFKDKREREEYINQLGEEFDQQLKEVEERANKRARDELEAEKRRLRDMMQTERETLQHHYKTLEKMSKMVESGQAAGGSDQLDSGLFKVKSQLEDTFNENRQLKKSLLDTKTDVALIWKEMEKLKKQYEVKLSSAYEKQRETQHECDHIKRQLDLMKDSNQKLQDASDVITSYITDKVEPVIKVALDGDGELGASSLNGCSLRLGSNSASNSRRGSILSEYLNDDSSRDNVADLESMASSGSGGRQVKQRRLKTSVSSAQLAGADETDSLQARANGKTEPREYFLNVPDRGKPSEGQLVRSAGNKSPPPATEAKSAAGAKSADDERAQVASVGSTRQNLKSFGRRLLGNRTQSSETKESAGSELQSAGKTKLAELESASAAEHAHEHPIVEPADGPGVATFNIILVGDSFVGKSSFAARFIEGDFVQGLISNCSIDFKTKSFKVDGVNYTVNLWDTAGQERFRSITASYFRKADGIILMYDVTDKRSYLNVRNWMSTISDTAAENVAVLLVGNKIDLRQNDSNSKCVPAEEGSRLAREYDIVFLETSVKTGTNLLPSMGKLIRLIAKNNTAVDEDTDRIRLSDKGRTFNCMPKNC